VADADRTTGGDQREELEANRVRESPIHLQREVPGLVDDSW